MSRSILVILSVVFLLVFLSGTVTAKILFQDDFEGKDCEDNWVIVIGDWQFKDVDGNGVAWHDGAGSETILIKDMIFDDFIAELRILHISDSAGAQIYWNTNEGAGNAAGEGYLFGEDASGDTIRWYRVSGGSPTLQDQFAVDISPDTWTWFKVRMEGTRAQMWYKREGKDEDYILAFDVDDLDEYEDGAIGTWFGGEALVDDFLVTDLKGAAVEACDKLISAWGKIKSKY